MEVWCEENILCARGTFYAYYIISAYHVIAYVHFSDAVGRGVASRGVVCEVDPGSA